MRKQLKFIAAMILLLIISCDEPETVVTNYVHPDGSVTRKIEMRNIENDFATSGLQIPFDSTWTISDSTEISEKGDTTWVKRAEKTFISIEELNSTYVTDSGANRNVPRNVTLTKKFKWFNTEFRFSENIPKTLEFGYPVSDFLNGEELVYFYSPQNLKDEQINGTDSLKFRMMGDSINYKSDKWATSSIISTWIGQLGKLTEGKDAEKMISSLKSDETRIARLLEEKYGEKFDSLWENGIILKELVGAGNAVRYRAEADSAIKIATESFFIDFKEYSVRTVMPGKLTATNGYIDSSNILLWPVKSDFFLTQQYEMWAESKVPNIWAWILSGVFVMFVLTGVTLRAIKRG